MKPKLKIRSRIGNSVRGDDVLDESVPYAVMDEIPHVPQPPAAPTRHKIANQSWGIEAVSQPKKDRIRKTKSPNVKHRSSSGFWGKKKNKTVEVPESEVNNARQDVEKKKRIVFPWKKENQPDLSPLESGVVTVPDLLAPASVDFTSRDYVVVDSVYHGNNKD